MMWPKQKLKWNRLIFLLFLFTMLAGFDFPPHNNDSAIIGYWMSTEKNPEVEVFKTGNEFKAGLYGLTTVIIKVSP